MAILFDFRIFDFGQAQVIKPKAKQQSKAFIGEIEGDDILIAGTIMALNTFWHIHFSKAISAPPASRSAW